MARRPAFDDRFIAWLRLLGDRVRQHRLDRGWTQPVAAERAGLDYKHYQAVESGRARITMQTLFAIAHALSVDPAGLLPVPGQTPRPQKTQVPASWRLLRKAGWRVRPAGEHARSRRAVPVYDLVDAANSTTIAAQAANVVAWATPPRTMHKDTAGLFLARVARSSVADWIPSGAWCLFRRPVLPPLLGRIVLVWLAGEGAFGVRRVGALAVSDDGGAVHVRVDALNPGIASVVLVAPSEGEFAAIGEWLAIVANR
jgi:transcriptional regulator with XRE-family HTH domain